MRDHYDFANAKPNPYAKDVWILAKLPYSPALQAVLYLKTDFIKKCLM